MEKLNIYFFHGFLGHPLDWVEVAKHLENQKSYRLHFPNLLELFVGFGGEQSMQQFAETFAKDFINPEQTNILVGYSMGGRLAMHFSPDYFDRLLLVSAHPGLCSGHETRRQLDRKWIELGSARSKQQWLKEWNSQPIFREDKIRPEREITDAQFKNFLSLMQAWSLAEQKNQTAKLAKIAGQVHWAYGSQDEKYKLLGKELQKNLGESQVSEIAGAGHGVIFDQPLKVAKWIGEIIGVA